MLPKGHESHVQQEQKGNGNRKVAKKKGGKKSNTTVNFVGNPAR